MIELGLSRISRLLSHLGDPQNTFKAFHVAGTNGKGSVVAYIASALQAAGYRTGRFTSPHLIHEYDAIEIDNCTVTQSDYNEAHKYVSAIDRKYEINATEFEMQTATAFELLKRAHVEFAAVEVGLGGKLDATNVLSPQNVLCCAITKIAVDHESLLGNTIEEIAKHKAGIAKLGVPLVVDGTNAAGALEVIKKEASMLGSSSTTVVEKIPDEYSALFENALLPGRFQLQNAAVAYETLRQGLPVLAPKTIALGFKQVSWPGRLEQRVIKNHQVLIDGAHNVNAAEELAAYVRQTLRGKDNKRVCWVVAFSKPSKEILKRLVERGDRVIATKFTKVEGMPWIHAQKPEDIKAAAIQLTDESLVSICASPNDIEFDDKLASIVCGSLYILKEFN